MKIVIAPNSFKGSLSASDVIRHAAAGLTRAVPDIEIQSAPMADGGDGTAHALHAALGGRIRRMATFDPLGRPIRAQYIDATGHMAIIEMAAASGLALLRVNERHPMLTSTLGVGLMIRRCIEHGARHVIVGAGGSATVDGGAGALQAMGARLFDGRGSLIDSPMSGGTLHRIARIDLDAARSLMDGIKLEVYADVTNPLLGAKGAARVFAPQKGATPRQVAALESTLAHWAKIIKRNGSLNISHQSGMGAAGGLAFGLAAGVGAGVVPGAPAIARLINLPELIRKADVVITGEGEVNGQTLEGKAPIEVARIAAQFSKPCYIFCGQVGEGAERITKQFQNVILWPIATGPITASESIRLAPRLIRDAAQRLGQTIRAFAR